MEIRNKYYRACLIYNSENDCVVKLKIESLRKTKKIRISQLMKVKQKKITVKKCLFVLC